MSWGFESPRAYYRSFLGESVLNGSNHPFCRLKGSFLSSGHYARIRTQTNHYAPALRGELIPALENLQNTLDELEGPLNETTTGGAKTMLPMWLNSNVETGHNYNSLGRYVEEPQSFVEGRK